MSRRQCLYNFVSHTIKIGYSNDIHVKPKIYLSQQNIFMKMFYLNLYSYLYSNESEYKQNICRVYTQYYTLILLSIINCFV